MTTTTCATIPCWRCFPARSRYAGRTARHWRAKSTLSRLEHAPAGGKPSRYAKIDHDPEKLQDVLAESFIDSWQGLPPSRLVLDIDSTDDEVHGRQEGRSFHGYYNHYCFLPLYITCGGRPLFALLRPGSADPRRGRDRAARQDCRPAPPGVAMAEDPASCRFRVCPRRTDDLVQGQRRGLCHRPGEELAAGRADWLGTRRRRGGSGEEGPPGPAGSWSSPYATLTSWSCQRRVIAKAEHLTDKSNPRFVVTSLPADTFSARTVYERLYCARGNMENTIKEQQLDLFSDRTSATCFAANQLRAPLLRLRIDPLLRHQASASRHPTGSRHSRNAPAQAPQDRRPPSWSRCDGSRSPWDSAHPFRRSVRTGPRAITRVVSRRS